MDRENENPPVEPEVSLSQVEEEYLKKLDQVLLQKKKRKAYLKEQARDMGSDVFLSNYIKSMSIDLTTNKHGDRHRIFDGALIMHGILTDTYGKLPKVNKDTKRVVHKQKPKDLLNPAAYSTENPALMEWVARNKGDMFGLSLKGIGMMVAYTTVMTRLQGKDLHIDSKGKKK